MVYNNPNIFIHNNFKTILDICIKISNKDKENSNNKSIVYQTLKSFVKKILDNLSLINNTNPNNSRTDNISFFIQKYLYFLIDLIEIQSNLGKNEINIIITYINILSGNINNMKT